jgi:hypothetical protein
MFKPQDMERSGIRPNGVFVSSVIHALLEKGNISMAQAVSPHTF